jgi:hypothetical protein
MISSQIRVVLTLLSFVCSAACTGQSGNTPEPSGASGASQGGESQGAGGSVAGAAGARIIVSPSTPSKPAPSPGGW